VPIQSLTREEIRSLFEQAWAHKRRDWLMLLVGYSHALRASEVVALTPDNIHDGFLTVQRLKGSDKTTQPLLENADGLFSEKEALIEYAQQLQRNQRLFPITRQHFWRLMQRYAEWAGLPEHKRHPHCLKHSLCSQVIHSAGIEHVRQYAGHKSLSSTGAYLKVTDEQAADAIHKALKV
jgi:integrase/recombinase XerD